MLSIDAMEVDQCVDGQALFALQPRAYEGCFGRVDEKGDIDVYLIQDQMPFWLLAFFEHDLKIAFDVIKGLPLLSLRYRHFQVTFPIYDAVPTSGRLRLCIIELEEMKVVQINRHVLEKRMLDALGDAVRAMETRDSETVYVRFDAIKDEGLEAEMFDKAMTDTLKAI